MLKCSSYYPATILNLGVYPQHLGKEWLEGYRETFHKRLKEKKDGNKSVAEALKLSLNGGGYGKTNEAYSWQFDPLVAMSVTLTGQLSLLMLIENLEEEGMHVVSANTDGIVTLVSKKEVNKYYDVCQKWETKTNYQLEYTYYKQIIQTSVNDYLAEKDDGTTKKKGDFRHDTIQLWENPSMKIRAIALEEYFIHNKPVAETIKNHKNIYDFCKRFKTSKGWKAYEYSTNGTDLIKTAQQKNIRYYISKNGNKLTKCNIKDGREISVEASVGVTIFNKFEDKDMKDYNIDYSYYVSETNKLIYSISDGQLKLF